MTELLYIITIYKVVIADIVDINWILQMFISLLQLNETHMCTFFLFLYCNSMKLTCVHFFFTASTILMFNIIDPNPLSHAVSKAAAHV